MTATLLSTVLASEGSSSFPILPALVFVPMVGAILIALMPRSRPELSRQMAILTALLTGILSIALLIQFKTDDPGFQFVVQQTWVKSLDIKFFLGVDGISLFLVVLTGILFPIALFAAKPEHSPKGYYAWLTLLMAGCMGAFLALDLFLFFLMFEITLVPLYMLIGKWGHGRRVYAATKFFLYTMLGSAFMLVSIVALAVIAGAGENGGVSFDFTKIIAADNLATSTGRWLFLGMAIAFAVKVPSFPFHTWLPDAHTEAPTAGSIDLAGILLKLGTYGFLRYGLELFPEATVWFAPVMLTLATIGVVYGGIVAAMQRNLKRLVAYSSVAHMGFALMGLFALNVEGIEGSVLQMVNHGITTGALFILLGFLYTRRHTYEISQLKGIAKVAPVFAGVFTVVMLASIGVPGLNGFVGEFLVLLGTFVAHRLGRRRRHRCHHRGALPALGLPARVPGRTRRGQSLVPRSQDLRETRHGSARGTHRVPRHLPQARHRPHRAVGEARGHPTRGRGRRVQGADHARRIDAHPEVGHPRAHPHR